MRHIRHQIDLTSINGDGIIDGMMNSTRVIIAANDDYHGVFSLVGETAIIVDEDSISKVLLCIRSGQNNWSSF